MGLKKPKSIKHNGRRVSEILEAHDKFFSGKDGGARADLTGANLSGADLSGANLTAPFCRTPISKGRTCAKRGWLTPI